MHTNICGGAAQHNYEANPEVVKARQIRGQIKKCAVNQVAPIPLIYEPETSK